MDAKNKSKMVAKKFKLTDAFWTGLFVFIVSGLIWWGYGQLTKEDIKEGFFIKVKFDNIFGLEKDDEVIFKGLLIGEVKEITTVGGRNSTKITPIVTLNIDEKFTDLLYNDTRFSIKSPLLLGDYSIEATRPLSLTSKRSPEDRLKEGQIIEGFTELNPGDFAAGIEENLTPILVNFGVFSAMLSELVLEGELKDDITNSFRSLSESLNELEKVLKTIEIDDDSKIEISKVNESIANFHKSSQNFDRIINNLDEIIIKMNNSDGTLSKLLNDGSLYDEYTEIAKNTNILIKDIKENPKRYIKWTDIIKGWRSKDDN